MSSLLVTNDFPPKVGGIQSYLWELWRRLPGGRATVLTTPYTGAAAFDRDQPFQVRRWRQPVLLPTPAVASWVRDEAGRSGARLVMLDPALPLGLLGPDLGLPYGVVLHGAEVTVPARIPGARALLRRVLRGASVVVAAGGYPASEASRLAGARLPLVVVPPGVDADHFRPLDPAEREKARAAAGLPASGRLVVGLSRLVPRKGFDVLVAAAALLAPGRPDLTVAIAGGGRDRDRLERLVAATGAPVRLLGRVADPAAVVGAADVFAVPCRNRWAGMEQEGFGIVFVEAAACGVPAVAGASGGAAEAVVHGETGLVVDRPDDPMAVATALASLLDDGARRTRQARAARMRAETEFSYTRLAEVLDRALAAHE